MVVDGTGLRVGILGPLEVSRDGETVVLAGEKLAVALAVLASAAGRPVGGATLADRIWPERLPERVRGSLQTLVMRLRRALGPGAIARVGDGYRLDIHPDDVDLLRFRRLVGEATAADHPGTARELLGEALGLWRGEPLTGVRSPSLERDEIPGLIEERLVALHRRIELDLAAGRHDAVTAELRELTGRYPLRESLWRQLIVALNAAGRPAEAIQAYHAVRARLAEELGIDPSAALQSLYRSLLRGNAGTAVVPAGAAAQAMAVPAVTVTGTTAPAMTAVPGTETPGTETPGTETPGAQPPSVPLPAAAPPGVPSLALPPSGVPLPLAPSGAPSPGTPAPAAPSPGAPSPGTASPDAASSDAPPTAAPPPEAAPPAAPAPGAPPTAAPPPDAPPTAAPAPAPAPAPGAASPAAPSPGVALLFQHRNGADPRAGAPGAGRPSAGRPSAGRPSVRPPNAGQLSAGESSTRELPNGQPNPRQPSPGQPISEQPNAGHHSPGRDSPGRDSPRHHSPRHHSPGHPGAGHQSAEQPDPGQPSAEHPNAGQPSAGQPSAGQPSAGELSLSRLLGRRREVDALDRWLAGAADGSMPTIAALVGPAGIGKTTLALRWAGRQYDRFPDGRLHLDLRGYGPHPPMHPLRALESLLHELRVPAEDIPPGLDERASLLREVIGTRRMVVLLDNARDAAQVRPLLPGPGCLVVVTSRSQLRGLVAYDGAYRVALGRVRVAEARALLDATGAAGLHGYDNDDIATVVDRCAGLPLALRIVAERLARNGFDLPAVIAELDGPDGRLDALRTGDDDLTDMRTVLSWSYRALDPDAARAFRLAGAQPGADLDPAAAAVLLGRTRPETGAILDRLVGAHLLERQPTGRYRMPELLRAYAAELSRTVAEDRAAIRAMLDWYASEPSASRLPSVAPGPAAPYPLPAGRPRGARDTIATGARDTIATGARDTIAIGARDTIVRDTVATGVWRQPSG